MNVKKLIASFVALYAAINVNAQFYSLGNDPGFLKWSYFDTPAYRIIFPQGLDSLACDFALELEKYKIPVGNSIGTIPNETRVKPLPVVIHPYTTSSNGSVAWAPRRMELYTVMQSDFPLGLQNKTQLAIHESRHAAQMESFNKSWKRYLNYAVGEIASGGLSALYGGRSFMEGDAVTAETALTSSGRGRSADFLEYFMTAFDEGDYRDYYKWRYTQQNLYSPDFYSTTYISTAGYRALWNNPFIAKDVYSSLNPIFPLGNSIEKTSGMKARQSFKEIELAFASEWDSLRTLRKAEGFFKGETLSPDSRLFREYRSLCYSDSSIYAIRSGLDLPCEIVRILPGGSVKHICYYRASSSDIQWSDRVGKLIFSTEVPDLRWELCGSSRICSLDPKSGKFTYLTKEGRLYNPSPSMVKDEISVTSYPVEGGSAVLVLDSHNGKALRSYYAPQGVYVTETAWDGDRLYAAAVVEGGFAFFDVTGGWNTVLGPESVQVKQLRSTDGNGILFVSDMNGVNELYRFREGALTKLSNTRNGASDFALSPSGRLYYSELTTEKRAVKSVSCPSESPASFIRTWSSPIADCISAQEKSLLTPPDSSAWNGKADIKPYHKASHLFRFHSWIPLFVELDDISSISYETLEESASLGAMAFFQNSLSSTQGYIGYSINKSRRDWINGGHMYLKYTGLMPVFSAKLDYYDTGRSLVKITEYEKSTKTSVSGTKYVSSNGSLSGEVQIYLPLNLSSKGWTAGLVPHVSYRLSNSMYDTSPFRFRERYYFDGKKKYAEFVEYGGKKINCYNWLHASVRAYRTLPIPTGSIYPKWGMGGEVGYICNPGLSTCFSPALYWKVYGYVPGIMSTHGLRMSFINETLTKKDSYFLSGKIDCLPRGFGVYDYSYAISNRYTSHSLLSFDYAFPLLPIGWAGFENLFYINDFELTPHFDLAMLSGSRGKGTLTSVGAKFLINFENFIIIPFRTKIGVSYSYNGGSLLEDILYSEDEESNRYSIGLVFSIDL